MQLNISSKLTFDHGGRPSHGGLAAAQAAEIELRLARRAREYSNSYPTVFLQLRVRN